MTENLRRVCVTGCGGYIASWLIMRLIKRGYTVHATTRNLAQVNVQVLKSLPDAGTKLRLFKTDISDKDGILRAVQGCHCVFHMATPFLNTLTGFNDMTEAAMAAVRCIVEASVKSGTVKRIIYTSSITSTSPLYDAATSHSLYRDFIGESCWTPVDTDLPFADHSLLEYGRSKTVAEKELLKYNETGETEVVSLSTGLVGGNTIHASFSNSLKILLSQIRGDEVYYKTLRFIKEVVGKVPIIHIEDVCNAHIYSMETPSIKGRYLCANGYLKTSEISDHFIKHYPNINISKRLIEDTERTIRWGSTKLEDAGFKYEYDADATLVESVKCGIRLGEITFLSYTTTFE